MIVIESALYTALLIGLWLANCKADKRHDSIIAAMSVVGVGLDKMSSLIKDNGESIGVSYDRLVRLQDSVSTGLRELEGAIMFNGPDPDTETDPVTNTAIGQALVAINNNQVEAAAYIMNTAEQLEFLHLAINRNGYYQAPSAKSSN